jgi:hypothetical protein
MRSENECFIEIDNPYRPDLEKDYWFFDTDVINDIKKILTINGQKKTIVIQGNAGSGKTRILKRIAEELSILGENFIPVYLDSRDYRKINLNDALFFMYKNAAKNLKKFGHYLIEPDYTTRQDIKAGRMRIFINAFKTVFERGKALVLIFDEFDSLLETLDAKSISTLISYFRHIEEKAKIYGLIFASDRKLANLPAAGPILAYLELASYINIEDVLEKENIRRLIEDPVKEQLYYDNESIEQIISLTGNNLYFQQLICYYLFNLLSNKKRCECHPGDIDEAIQKILDDNKPEFSYAWENKLNMEGRLIASALADENITKKRGAYYFIEEDSLLDNILGDRMNTELEKLYVLGYINKISGRRFSRFPIKIPLYARWIQKEHPFVNTAAANIDKIVVSVSLDTLSEVIRKIPAHEIPLLAKEKFLEITQKWFLLKSHISKMQETLDKNEIGNFIHSFFEVLDLNVIQESYSNIAHFSIDISKLYIGILKEACCFVQDRPELKNGDISYIENTATAHSNVAQTKLTLLFCFREIDAVENLAQKPYLNLISIGDNELKRILVSQRPNQVFRGIILGKLSLNKISPYKTEGPARATFYGRAEIINKIVCSKERSFSIVGARKIGKSSLLLKLKDEPPPNTVYIFMNIDPEFSNVQDYSSFLKSLEIEIKRFFGKDVYFEGDISRIPEIIRKLSESGQRIIFMLDEIDALVEFDKRFDYKLLKIFRTMSQHNYCQFIFAGFKSLYHQKRNIQNPLYNFCEEILLTPLDRNAALDLVTKPMKSIGINYKNADDRDLILLNTSCHPNLIQFLCKHLIEKVEKHQHVNDKRTIYIRDIEDLNDLTYEEYIIDQVYMFFSDLTDINKLIILLLTSQSTRTFSIDQVKQRLETEGLKLPLNDIHKNMREMVMRFIFLDQGRDRYSFALPLFPDILEKRIPRDFIDHLIKEVKSSLVITEERQMVLEAH